MNRSPRWCVDIFWRTYSPLTKHSALALRCLITSKTAQTEPASLVSLVRLWIKRKLCIFIKPRGANSACRLRRSPHYRKGFGCLQKPHFNCPFFFFSRTTREREDNEHPLPVSGYEENQSGRQSEGRAQDVPLVKGKWGVGKQARGLLYWQTRCFHAECSTLERERTGASLPICLQPPPSERQTRTQQERPSEESHTSSAVLTINVHGGAGNYQEKQQSVLCCWGVCCNITVQVCVYTRQDSFRVGLCVGWGDVTTNRNADDDKRTCELSV